MKKIVVSIVVLSVILSACGDSTGNSDHGNKAGDTSKAATQETTTANAEPASVDESVTAYLLLKNALTNDNSNEAAEAGRQLHAAFSKLDNASFAADQRKVYDEVNQDMKEHAEHISANAGKIAHQREHFDVLSKDMYDLVRSVKPTQTLYKDHCPMFNDNKGAIWLSEVKDIKNPYYGKKMLTCGERQEEIN